jgi:release factor glutamine methyltransferase
MSDNTQTLMQQAVQQLEEAGCDSPLKEVRALLAYATDKTREALWCELPELTPSQKDNFLKLVQRRQQREPLAYILGVQPFWTLDFFVSPHSLCPRSDSEALIELLLKHLPDKKLPLRIIDLGVGSGCLLLTMLHELPNALGVGVDASAEALKVAQKNAQRLNLSERVEFKQANWKMPETIPGSFDVIISNPPYIESADMATLMPEVRDFEPHLALDGGEDGLDAYREIINQVSNVAKESAMIAFEVGVGQATDVIGLAESVKLKHIATMPDLSGIERAILFEN